MAVDSIDEPGALPPRARASRLARPFFILFVVGAVLITSIIGMNAIVLGNLRETSLRNTEIALVRRSNILAEQAERSIHSVDLILDSLVAHVRGSSIKDAEGFRVWLAGFHTHALLRERLAGLPQLEALTLFGSDGVMVNSSRAWPLPTANISKRREYELVRDVRGPSVIVSGPLQNPFDGGWTVLLLRRVENQDGDLIGIVAGSLSLDYFDRIYRSIAGGTDETYLILRSDGLLLFRFPKVSLVGQPTDLVPMNVVSWATREVSPLDGVDRIWSGRKLRTYPLAIVTSTTTERALAGWWAMVRLSVVLSGIGVLFVLGACFAVYRWWNEHSKAAAARTAHAEAEHARALAQAELLREREQAADAANLAKSEFLATMSHEIRTPLNAVLGLATTLLESDLDHDQRGSVVAMHNAGDNLLRILNDILDISKLEAGRMEFEEIPFSPSEMIDNALSIIGQRAAAKGLALQVQEDPRLPPVVFGDVGRLKQVLLNLLSNAVKFTTQGEVRLVSRCLALQEGRVRVEWRVEDTGVGIPADRIGRLFNKFTQADASINRRFGGTGLGLAISKQIIEQMGGTIEVSSRPGVGTSFMVRIELAYGDALRLEHKTDVGSVTALQDLLAELGRPLRLLVAEDNPTNQLVIVKMLKDLAVSPHIVGDGAEAVAAIAQFEFDLVFMDVRMPEMDGLEATRCIRSRGDPVSRIPIVAITANAYPDDIKVCREAGMTGFVAKPVRKHALIAAMVDVLTAMTSGDAGAHGAPRTRPMVANATPEDAPLDHATLALLIEEIGEEATELTVQVFLAETEARLAKMRDLSCADQRATIRTEAHTLKGASATLGLRTLAALARTLETSAGDIAPADYAATLDRMTTAFEKARRSLDKELAQAA